jgi:hypothetical protein
MIISGERECGIERKQTRYLHNAIVVPISRRNAYGYGTPAKPHSLLVHGNARRCDLLPLPFDILLDPIERGDYLRFQLLLILARGEDIEHFVSEL